MKGVNDFLSESQGKSLAVTVLIVPYSLDSALGWDDWLLRDQICVAQGLKVNCLSQDDF